MSKEILDYLIRTQAAYTARLQGLPDPGSYQREPFYKRRLRLLAVLTAGERREMLVIKGKILSFEVLAYTLDGRGKLVQRSGSAGGYNVMFLGSDDKTWWYYGGRRQHLETAIAVLESADFARHRNKAGAHGAALLDSRHGECDA